MSVIYVCQILNASAEGEKSTAVVGEAQNLEIDPVMNVVVEVEDDKFSALTAPGPFENLDWDLVGDDVGIAGVDMKVIVEVSMKEVMKRKRFRAKYICNPYIAPMTKRLKVGMHIYIKLRFKYPFKHCHAHLHQTKI
ncbi:unnamed protein product [Cuscuta epithymum]|uniref:Uncharacterized protein n=1 Tax=Cuscuta epithymum TaxID=186058 RepID=A0AAV0DLC8_9ASTE|nr:unnamed protein product [Cuscuta epithymum]